MPHPDEGTLHAWLDGALPADEAARVEAHAAECAACAAAVAEARGLIAASSRIVAALDRVPGGVVPASVPEEARTPAPASVPAREPARVVPIESARPRVSRWRVGPLRAAAAVLLVAGGAAVVFRSTEGPTMALEPQAAPDRTVTAATADVAAPEASAPSARDLAASGSAAPAAQTATEGTTGMRAAPPVANVAGALAAPPPPSAAPSAAPRARTVAPEAAADEAAQDALAQAAERREAQAFAGAAAAPPAPPPVATGAAVSGAEAMQQAPAAGSSVLAVRTVPGWTVTGSALVRDGAGLVRRTTYRLPSGAEVVLEEAPTAPNAADGRDAAAEEAAKSVASDMALRRVERGARTVVRWRSEAGTSLALSGTLDARTLEALREELRRASP